MNKRSYGEPCKNSDGNYDNNLCVTGYCDDTWGLCNYRANTEDCRNMDTGKINLVDRGGGYSGNTLGECEGDCDGDELSTGVCPLKAKSVTATCSTLQQLRFGLQVLDQDRV